MQLPCATTLSTLEMLDAVEARLAALRNELRGSARPERASERAWNAALRAIAMMPPPAGRADRTRSHPFSRIEDL